MSAQDRRFTPASAQLVSTTFHGVTYETFNPAGIYFLDTSKSYPSAVPDYYSASLDHEIEDDASDDALQPTKGRFVGGVKYPSRASRTESLYSVKSCRASSRPVADEYGELRRLRRPVTSMKAVCLYCVDVGIPGIAPTVYFTPPDPPPDVYPFASFFNITVDPSRIARRGVNYRMGIGAVAFRSVMTSFASGRLAHTSSARWNVLWAKRLQPADWQCVGLLDRCNHFPSSWGLGRKDNFAANIAAMGRLYDAYVPGAFTPRSWMMPLDRYHLTSCHNAAVQAGKTLFVIAKPPAMSCGRGIQVFRSVPELVAVMQSGTSRRTARGGTARRKWLVQEYVHPPLTMGRHKFDLRLYVLVTSVDPLRILLFRDGLVRFASAPYCSPEVSQSRNVHLTNFAIAKDVSAGAASSRAKGGPVWATVPTGCHDAARVGLPRDAPGPSLEELQAAGYGEEPFKWSLDAYRRVLRDRHGISFDDVLLPRIEAAIIKTIVAIERDLIASVSAASLPHRDACFELFGFDVMLREDGTPFVLEVNIMPSLATGTPLDRHLKASALTGLFTTIGVTPYDRAEYRAAANKAARQGAFAMPLPPGTVAPRSCAGQATLPAVARMCPARAFVNSGTFDMSARLHGVARGALPSSLSPMEQFVIASTEAESRRGMLAGWDRIFPRANSWDEYGQYFGGPRYFSQLICAWECGKLASAGRSPLPAPGSGSSPPPLPRGHTVSSAAHGGDAASPAPFARCGRGDVSTLWGRADIDDESDEETDEETDEEEQDDGGAVRPPGRSGRGAPPPGRRAVASDAEAVLDDPAIASVNMSVPLSSAAAVDDAHALFVDPAVVSVGGTVPNRTVGARVAHGATAAPQRHSARQAPSSRIPLHTAYSDARLSGAGSAGDAGGRLQVDATGLRRPQPSSSSDMLRGHAPAPAAPLPSGRGAAAVLSRRQASSRAAR